MVAPSVEVRHRTVEANGIQFHVAESGQIGSPQVLLLHGIPEGSESWGPVMNRLPGLHLFAPDLRAYPGTERPEGSPRRLGAYDPLTLSDDIKALIEALGLDRPMLVAHDIGGGMAWIFAHRYSEMIRKLVIVNCTHTRTLARAIVRCQDLQTFRVPWLPVFQLPWLPENLLTTKPGLRFMRWCVVVREARKGAINRPLVDTLIARFKTPYDLAGPINWYRGIFVSFVSPRRFRALYNVYKTPITAPVTMVWGMHDGALPAKIAERSGADAGCEIDWRPLDGVGHFVTLEAPDRLAEEIERALSTAPE